MSNQRLSKRLKKDVKAISPLIATLLLIAIAVAASVITYSWVMSMIGSQSQQAQTQIRIDTITWNIDTDPITNTDTCIVVVRNTGSVAATVESVSIRKSTSGSTFYPHKFTESNSINTGLTVPFTWEETTTGASAPVGFIAPLTEYVIRVTTTTGFQYEMVATSPSA